MMKLVRKIIPDTANCFTGKKLTVETPVITIHWTGPYPGQSPDMVRNWWINSKGEASAHYIVKDDEVIQCWDNDTVAWHTGTKSGNNTSIGIEVIPENIEGKFSEASINTLCELISMIPHKGIVRHYDWSGKDCPAYYCKGLDGWIALLNQIQ